MNVVVRTPGGDHRKLAVEVGMSLMQALRLHGIDGISADCGGASSCGTCRCRIAAEWLPRLVPPSSDELALLDLVDETTPSVRLTCQIELTTEMNGLHIEL